MSSVTENSETLAPRVANLSWRVRIALVTIFLIAVATVYFTNQFLTAQVHAIHPPAGPAAFGVILWQYGQRAATQLNCAEVAQQ